MSKSFILSLAFVVVLGAMLGGSFIGGIVYGQSQQTSNEEPLAPRMSAGGREFSRNEANGAGGIAEPGQIDLPPDTEPDGAPNWRNPLTGTAQGVAGDILTLETVQGERRFAINEDTAIYRIVPADVAEISSGVTVQVIGESPRDAEPRARTLIIVPEQGVNLFGPGDQRGDRRRGPRQN